VRRDGKVLCWGDSSSGWGANSQGDQPSNIAFEVYGISTATAVSVGSGFACALLGDGTIRCWGHALRDELGYRLLPVRVPGISSAVALSAGTRDACALLNDGTIQCWAGDSSGQFPGEPTTDGPAPVQGITGATAVAVGDSARCALLTDGTVRCWGANSYGDLGDGMTTDSSVPVAASGLTDAVSICKGRDHSCASLRDGSVRCWGANAFGENGDGTLLASSFPVAVSGLSNATAVACGANGTCTVLNDGSIQCWGFGGAGNFGAVGNPAVTRDCIWDPTFGVRAPFDPQPTITFEGKCSPTPVQIPGIAHAATVAVGFDDACAVLSDGSVQCWGSNDLGQLGDGSRSGSALPVSVLAAFGQ
jgi:alpha-tubulin suppressor-like RCC1 family protein